MNCIIEAQQKEFMTKTEEAVKRKLIALLKDDGHGHHHALFAKRLDDFIIRLSPETPTASMDYTNGIIRINPGFINVPPLTPEERAAGEKFPRLFRQLNVLMRHELAHFLMMHQVRLEKMYEKKYGKEAIDRIKHSRSLNKLENIIADFEISNKRYTDEDKETVRKMWLNGKLIGGLITETYRKDWQYLKLEDMYDAINVEIDKINTQIIQALKTQNTSNLNFDNDMLSYTIAKTQYYTNINSKSNFIYNGITLDIINDFINNKALYHFIPLDRQDKQGKRIACVIKASSIWSEWLNIIKNIHDGLLSNQDSNNPISDADIDKILTEIAQSGSTTIYRVTHPHTGEVIDVLYSPEEKLLAVDTLKELKNIINPYKKWFAKVKKALANPKYTKKDLEELENAIK